MSIDAMMKEADRLKNEARVLQGKKPIKKTAKKKTSAQLNNMVQLSDEFLKKWESLINEVDKSDVPVDCLKRVFIRFKDGKTRAHDISRLKKMKYSKQRIEEFITKKLETYGDSVQGVDFYVDIEAISGIVQKQTDKILNDLQVVNFSSLCYIII